MPLAVKDGEVAHRKPECARLEAAGATLRDQGLVSGLCIGEGIDGHGVTVSPAAQGGVGEGPV